jgi:hypothetical protein
MWQKDLCNVRTTVTRTAAPSLVSVKRIEDDRALTIAKRLKFLLDIGKAERGKKNHAAAQVYNAIRGAGSTEGSSRPGSFVGSNYVVTV